MRKPHEGSIRCFWSVATATAMLAGLCGSSVSPVSAAEGDITIFADSAGITSTWRPSGMTAGPDGNVWYTDQGTHRIGRITPDGTITTFADPGGVHSTNGPDNITAGADGNLWYTSPSTGRIGRITPAGVFTTFADPAGMASTRDPMGITAGPDGNLWFASYGTQRIGRIDPNAANPASTITTFADPSGTVSGPYDITAGPDGNLWFTSISNNRIGRIDPNAANPASTITTFADPSGRPDDAYTAITAGSDGNVWFTNANNHQIGRITPDGTITTFADPAGAGPDSTYSPYDITAGPDGNLWYSNVSSGRIGRIDPNAADPASTITTFAGAGAPVGIAYGPDGNIWFTNPYNSRIGRLELAPSDSTAPTAAPMQSPAANGGGWNNSDVTVDWHWADEADGSGIDSGDCTTSSTSAGEGAAIELTATCSDLAGNTGEASYTVQVDATDPSLSPSVSPDPVLVGGSATATSGATDGLSGLASQGCGVVSTVSVGDHTVECTATDVAGNSATASVSYRVEARVPHSKNDCKNGGWANLTDASGRPFRNQGDCVSYVATGGRNGAAG